MSYTPRPNLSQFQKNQSRTYLPLSPSQRTVSSFPQFISQPGPWDMTLTSLHSGVPPPPVIFQLPSFHDHSDPWPTPLTLYTPLSSLSLRTWTLIPTVNVYYCHTDKHWDTPKESPKSDLRSQCLYLFGACHIKLGKVSRVDRSLSSIFHPLRLTPILIT